MEIIRQKIRFYGDVQGVGFRFAACGAAEEVHATGWVRNESDGSVLMEIQGTEKQIKSVLNGIQRNRYIHIEQTDVRTIPCVAGEDEFTTRESMGDFFGFFRRHKR